MSQFYQKSFFAYFRWRSFIQTQKSESRFFQQIRKTFCENREEILIFYGDLSMKQQLRGNRPASVSGLRSRMIKFFKKGVVSVVDEAFTSKYCNSCAVKNKGESSTELKQVKRVEDGKVLRRLLK